MISWSEGYCYMGRMGLMGLMGLMGIMGLMGASYDKV